MGREQRTTQPPCVGDALLAITAVTKPQSLPTVSLGGKPRSQHENTTSASTEPLPWGSCHLLVPPVTGSMEFHGLAHLNIGCSRISHPCGPHGHCDPWGPVSPWPPCASPCPHDHHVPVPPASPCGLCVPPCGHRWPCTGDAEKAQGSDSPEQIAWRLQEVSAVLYHLQHVWGCWLGPRGFMDPSGGAWAPQES